MKSSKTFDFLSLEGERICVDISPYHSISIHDRFPGGEKIVTLEGFGGNYTIPIDQTRKFLEWLSSI